MTDRVAIVTGATEGGMGWEMALSLKRAGYTVYGTVRSESKAQPLKAQGIHPLILDVGDRKSIEAAFAEFEKSSQRLDILINNAGSGYVCSLLEGDLQKGKDLFDINFWGQLHVVQVFAPIMVKQRSGLIVNIGSLAGLRSFPWIGLYSATKAAVHAYTEGLRQELAPFNVKAIVVAPGLVTTKFEGSEWMDGRDTSRYYENLEVGFNNSLTTRDLKKNGMPGHDFAEYVVSEITKANPSEMIIAGGLSWNFKWVFPYLPIWLVDKLTSGDVAGVRAKELA